jgi:hypothetical protein
MIPIWLDGALRCAVSLQASRRYGELSELVYDLRHPNPRLVRSFPVPLVERDPLRFWRRVALVLLALNIVTLWLLLR